MNEVEPHVTEKKRNEVENIKSLLKEYRVMGIVNLQKLSAFNYMKIRYGLRGKLKVKYTRKTFMEIAFDETNDEKLTALKDRLIGIPALIFTNEEPFKLAYILKKNKSNALAKPGDIAPSDIIIPSGITEFVPGPMIGELGAMGIKTKVDKGKISIIADKLLVKKGEIINEKSAALMSKLKIEPIEVGLNLVLTYQDGEVLEGSMMDINIEDYINDIKKAANESLILALYIAYPSKETIELLIAKGAREGDYLAEKINFSELILDVSNKEKEADQQAFKEKNKDNRTEADLSDVDRQEKIKTDHSIKNKMSFDVKGLSDINEDDVKKAQKTLRDLTTKKLKGEI